MSAHRGEDLARLSEAVLGSAPAKSPWWKTVVLKDGSEMIVWRTEAPREYMARAMHRGSTIGTIRAEGRGKRPWRVIVDGYELTSRFPTLQEACEAFAAFHPKYDAVASALASAEGGEVPDLFETFERTLFWITDEYLGGIETDSVRGADLGDAMELWFLKNFDQDRHPADFQFSQITLMSVIAGGHRIDDQIDFHPMVRGTLRAPGEQHPSHVASTLRPGPFDPRKGIFDGLHDPRDVVFDAPAEVHIVWDAGSSHLESLLYVALTVKASVGDSLHEVLRRAWTEDMEKLARAVDDEDDEGVLVLPRDGSVRDDARGILKVAQDDEGYDRDHYLTPSLVVVGGRACRTDFARTWIVPSELLS